ncbi:hypothetical protein [Demequina sp. NBRC 110053]|uniref:hypothetical protein n=1 Tax=Demequina sp. NBRC 110053 TaxID=1570342 RepID=UPI0011848C0A|nr:hypothetical protein [Demequina sp. NBRC 110053]
MTSVIDIASWPLWDLDVGAWALLGALLVVVAQHGGTAGIHAAMGRDGLIDHRRSEWLGAVRGTVMLVALMGPVLVIWAVDAFSSAERLDVYLHANQALAAVYVPITVIAFTAFVLARVTPWQVRSNLNSVVLGTLELLRPWLAAAGMVAAAIVTRDATVAVIGALGVAAGLLVGPATRRRWYSRPVRLDDLGESPPSEP